VIENCYRSDTILVTQRTPIKALSTNKSTSAYNVKLAQINVQFQTLRLVAVARLSRPRRSLGRPAAKSTTVNTYIQLYDTIDQAQQYRHFTIDQTLRDIWGNADPSLQFTHLGALGPAWLMGPPRETSGRTMHRVPPPLRLGNLREP